MFKFSFSKYLFVAMLLLFIGALVRIDRTFFKQNRSFCVRFIYPSIPPRAEWELPSPSSVESAALDEILKQKFYYLAKGAHCFAFVSEDQKYVIKFHRYPSHLRVFPWLNRPLAYHFSKKRKAILNYNMERLAANMQSYADSALLLKEETGIILAHINRTQDLKRTVTLVDITRAEYQVLLDDVTFILQHKANLIYPTLDHLVSLQKMEEAKDVVSQVITLIADCCKKGFIDKDPILRRNYGLLNQRAIHIDVGDLVKDMRLQQRENYIPHVREMTESLRVRLEKEYPQELLAHYYREIEKL